MNRALNLSENSLCTFVTAVVSANLFSFHTCTLNDTENRYFVSDLFPEITKEGLLCLSYLFLGKVEKDLVPLGLLSFKMIRVRYFAVQYLGEFCDFLGRTNEDNIVSVSHMIIFVAF